MNKRIYFSDIERRTEQMFRLKELARPISGNRGVSKIESVINDRDHREL